MDTYFPYSQYVTGRNFMGRRTDVTLLGNLLAQGEHVVLSEPPKTGKTGAVVLLPACSCMRFRLIHFPAKIISSRRR